MKYVKRMAALLCVMAMMLCSLPMTSKAASTKTGTTGDCTWTLSGTTLTISGTGKMGNCSYDDKGNLTLAWGNEITSIVIKKGVTSIGAYAFYACVNLTSVTIADSVTSIGTAAFFGCKNLKDIALPKNLTDLGSNAFANCKKLESVTVPKGVKCIGTQTFCFCDNLKTVVIPSSVKTIDEQAFAGCSENLTISGSSGSYAETYAKANNIKFTVTGTTTAASKLTAKLSATSYTYNGNVKTPTVTVTDGNGTKLKMNTDYTVTYSDPSSKNVGTYKVTVNFTGNYSGSTTLNYTIYPAAPTKVTAKLYGYKNIQVSWSKVTGATAYKVYYKKTSAKSYTDMGTTSGTSLKKANFAAGTTYLIKVVPCYGSAKAESVNTKTASITTLKAVSTPTVKKASSKKVKVSWKNIEGESGYQISYSTSKKKNGTIKTYNGSSLSSKTISVKKNKTYYYKVRAFKTVNGKRIYGPWSGAKAFKLK